MTAEPIGVLVMAYGGPGNIAEVEPYLMDVRGGRATKPQLVEEIRARYARIGGRSPILELTRAQAAAIGRELGARFTARVGMRHWHPYIQETVDDMAAQGLRRVVGVAMAPHYSNMSVGAYEKKLLQAADGRLDVSLVRTWWKQPQFLDATAQRITEALQRFPKPADVQVIFTAHSLPEKILASADPYPDELKASAEAVAKRLGGGLAEWRFAYQSAGATADPWLGPDAEEVITELAKAGHGSVLLVPIGFVCDHVEILYDIDVEYQALAKRLGIQLERTRSLNDDPGLVRAVADVVRAAAAQRGWL
ncbi:MAG TPA: ferrochelatase [Gemmatimonadales bacterium]|nr:ferrochelatase [Gemmatimonadales bacterium]